MNHHQIVFFFRYHYVFVCMCGMNVNVVNVVLPFVLDCPLLPHTSVFV